MIVRPDWNGGVPVEKPVDGAGINLPTATAGAAAAAEISQKHTGGVPDDLADAMIEPGIDAGLYDKLAHSPDGIDASWSHLQDAAEIHLDAWGNNDELASAFDKLTDPLQTKILWVLSDNAGVPLDRVVEKIKGALTLSEAVEFNRAWQALKQRRGRRRRERNRIAAGTGGGAASSRPPRAR